MANPLIHSKSSVKRWGGKVEDYIAIHELIDSPKATMNNNSSRALTHNTWFSNGVKDVNNPEATKVADDLKERLSRQSRKDLDKRMTENNIK